MCIWGWLYDADVTIYTLLSSDSFSRLTSEFLRDFNGSHSELKFVAIINPMVSHKSDH